MITIAINTIIGYLFLIEVQDYSTRLHYRKNINDIILATFAINGFDDVGKREDSSQQLPVSAVSVCNSGPITILSERSA